MAVNKQMLYNDGEGLVHTDLNVMQGILRSQIFDTLGQMARLGLGTYEDQYRMPSSDLCYAIGAGGAPTASDSYFYAYSSGRVIHNRAGVIFQNIGNGADQNPGAPSGDAPEFLSYYVGENEWNTTLGANASGNPRIDIFCVKLDYLAGDSELRDFEDATTRIVTTQSLTKRSNVRCLTQVVTGTPSATPLESAVPLGYVKVWSCLVGNGVTNLSPSTLRDYRIPLGISYIDVACADVTGLEIGGSDEYYYKGTWASGTGYLGGRSVSALSGGEAYWIARARGLTGNQRLLGVQLLSQYDANATNWSATLVRLGQNSIDTLETMTTDLIPASSGVGVTSWRQSDLISRPYWGNGATAGHASDIDQNNPVRGLFSEIAVKVRSTAVGSGQVEKVRFVIAGSF